MIDFIESSQVEIALIFVGLLVLLLVLRVAFLLVLNSGNFKNSFIYYGRVTHTRLKGGAVHHLDYPIFLSYLDLKEIESIGWSLWPIFKVNSPYITFASFDYSQHLKDHQHNNPTNAVSMYDQVVQVVKSKAGKELSFSRMSILTNLTYFGYCFNPISVYYLFANQQKATALDAQENSDQAAGEEVLDTVIAEVSNTPWIEMHTYVLREGIAGIHKILRTTKTPKKSEECFHAIWRKDFHVSPFMAMDYDYDFQFYRPTDEGIKVISKMIKADSSKEVWFTANFELQSLPFTARNILYVLLFYPLQTRMIQVFIHWEAIKLFWKGVPTFEHPNGTDVNFGFGITGKRLGLVLWVFVQPIYWLSSLLSAVIGTRSDATKKKNA